MADANTVPTWVALVSTLIGGGLVGIFNFATNLINKKSEERRHLRELMFNAAIENWKQANELAIVKSKAGYKVNIAPLDSYIVHMIKLSEVLIGDTLSKENIREKLKEITSVTSEAVQYARDLDKAKKDSSASDKNQESTTTQAPHPFGEDWNK